MFPTLTSDHVTTPVNFRRKLIWALPLLMLLLAGQLMASFSVHIDHEEIVLSDVAPPPSDHGGPGTSFHAQK